MQTACNTPISPELLAQLDQPSVTARLPGPNEQMYYRPRQLDPLPDINDPVILAQLNKTQCVPDTPKGRLMLLLPDKRANRLAWCCAYWQFFNDGTHTWKRPSNSCGQVILCPRCAMANALEQEKKYEYLRPYVPDTGFSRISIPLDLSTPKAAYNQLVKHLRKLLPTAPNVMKIKPTSERVESLYCGSISPEQQAALRNLYPSISFTAVPPSQFREELSRVLAPDLPKSPEAVAALDDKYLKTRLLRVHGLTQEQRKNLTDERLSTKPDKSDGQYHLEPGKAPIYIPHCPHCGKLATKLCHWRHESMSDPTPEEFVDVILYTPPPKTE